MSSFNQIDIDLNLRLGPLTEILEDRMTKEEWSSSACSDIWSDNYNSFSELGEATTVENGFQGESFSKKKTKKQII